MKKVFVAMASVALLAACGGGQQEEKKSVGSSFQGELEGAPAWVTRLCAAFQEKVPSVCAVGTYGGTANISMAITGAETRARANLAKLVGAKVKSMVKDYMSSVTGGENYGKAASDEQATVSAIKEKTDAYISGAQRVDMWISKSNTIYVLMKWDVESFKNQLNQIRSLDKKTVDGIMQRAEKAWQELDADQAAAQ